MEINCIKLFKPKGLLLEIIEEVYFNPNLTAYSIARNICAEPSSVSRTISRHKSFFIKQKIEEGGKVKNLISLSKMAKIKNNYRQ